jgi:hypothetical protein
VGTERPGVHYLPPEGTAETKAPAALPADLEIGDPAFDARYVVRSAPPEFFDRLFSPERRAEIASTVTLLARFAPPRIDLSRESLSLEWIDLVLAQPSLHVLVRCARDMLRWLDELRPGPVPRPAAPAVIGRCPVCGMELRESVIRCGRCDTPHHAECWSYVGRCSTYACGGVTPRGEAPAPAVSLEEMKAQARALQKAMSDLDRMLAERPLRSVREANRQFYDAYSRSWRNPEPRGPGGPVSPASPSAPGSSGP